MAPGFAKSFIHSLSPAYLCETLTSYQHNGALCSVQKLLLEVPRSLCKQWDDCAFAVASKSWNSLPLEL